MSASSDLTQPSPLTSAGIERRGIARGGTTPGCDLERNRGICEGENVVGVEVAAQQPFPLRKCVNMQ